MPTKKELLEQKRTAEEEKGAALKELREIGEAGGDLPQELKDRATKANDEIARITGEIAKAETREREKAAENAERIREFEASLDANQPPTRHTRDTDRHPDPDVRAAGTQVITHEFIGDMAPQFRNLFEDFGYNREPSAGERLFTERMFQPDDGAAGAGMSLRHVLKHRPLQSRATFLADTAAQGGLGVPDDQRFFGILESRRRMFMGVERVSNVIYTDNDGDMPYHLVDTTGNQGEELAEEGDSTTYPDYAMVERILKSNRISSKIITATNKSLRSFSALTEGYIGFLLGESIGRREALRYAKGSGSSNQPLGIHTALGTTILSSTFVVSLAQTWDISDADVTGVGFRIPIDMWKDLDPAYWSDAGTIVMSPSFFNTLRAVKDGENRPMWPEMANRSQGGMFAWQSHPVAIDPNYDDVNFSTATADQGVATIGDHMGFRIRKVRGATILRNPYRDTEFKRDSVAFVMNQYCDSNIADPWGLRLIHFDSVA